MKRNMTWIKFIFLIAAGLLAVESSQLLQQGRFWSLFVNGIFILIALYMNFIYPRRQTWLNHDLMVILLIFFSGSLIRSILAPNLWMGVISLVLWIGFSTYLRTRHTHPYALNLKRRPARKQRPPHA
jgi:hypothetical protein